MAILNYTTTISAEKTASEIQAKLAKAKAQAVLCEYGDDGVMSSMMRCDQCKFWNRSEDFAYSFGSAYGLGLGKCDATRQFWDATEWDRIYNRRFIEAAAGVLAFTQDASDYHADLLTMPNFGCVQFQAKSGDEGLFDPAQFTESQDHKLPQKGSGQHAQVGDEG